jgi:hypothetical protein
MASGQAQSHLALGIVVPHQLMAQLVSIELKPLVEIRNWKRNCINPAKYEPDCSWFTRSDCALVANFSMRCVPQAVP